MPFGQVVIGPPGSGKTVYCNGMSQFLESTGRKVAIVNLDPSNENIPYTPTINIQDLIDFDSVVENTELGPNGVIQVFDSFYCKNPANFISVLLVSLSSMVRLELPHINVLSKMDLVEQNGPLDFQLDFYTDVLDLKYLNSFLDKDPRLTRFSQLNKAIAGIVEDYSLVSFTPLNIMDKYSVGELLKKIDKSNGYIYTSKDQSAVNDSIMEVSEKELNWDFDKYHEIQEKYYSEYDDDDWNYESEFNNLK